MRQPLLGRADQLAKAWQVSARHGVAFADVLDATRRDLDQRAAFARQVHARMAGPRASAMVLAGLPVFGVLLGELSGARPLHVLLGTTAGQFLLVLGAVFAGGRGVVDEEDHGGGAVTFLFLALAILVAPMPKRAIERLRPRAHDPPGRHREA